MKRLAEFIVKRRYVFLAVFIILAVLGAILMPRVEENYDLSVYLADDTETRQALDVMQREFESVNTLYVVKKDLTVEEAKEYKGRLSDIDGVRLVTFNSETGYVEGNALFTVNLVGDEYSDTAAFALGQIRKVMGDCYIGGAAAENNELKSALGKEIPVIMLIAVIIVMAMLLLTSHAYVEPLIFGIVILVAILINMGSNVIFPSVSYITKAVAAILQLALAMDYSIILLHSYSRHKDGGCSGEEAVAKALADSFRSIFSSALTTVAGLVSLAFMSFTIGFDIGMVLSKGIIVSMLTVYFMMPALIILFDGALRRTAHKPLRLGGAGLGKFGYKARFILPLVMTAVIVGAYFVQTNNSYGFTPYASTPAQDRVDALFGSNTQIAVMFDKAYATDAEAQSAFIEDVKGYTVDGKSVLNEYSSYLFAEVTLEDLRSAMGLDDGLIDKLKDVIGTDRLPLTRLVELVQGGGLGQTEVTGELLSLLGIAEDDAEALLRQVRQKYGNTRLSSVAEFIYDFAPVISIRMGWSKEEQEKIKELCGGFDELDLAVSSAITELYKTFNGESFSRILLNVDVEREGKETVGFVSFLKERASLRFGEENYLAGQCVSTVDISQAFNKDLLKVNLITIFAILLIVGLTFMSLSMPIILVMVIQGAIWIALAIIALSSQTLFFMSYIICSAIMMGATIDYGILLSNHYVTNRGTMTKIEAIKRAVTDSLPTVLTSGVILVVAGLTVGFVSTIMPIYSIGRLLGLGTVISLTLILFLLPSLLLLCDGLIMRTTLKRKSGQTVDKK